MIEHNRGTIIRKRAFQTNFSTALYACDMLERRWIERIERSSEIWMLVHRIRQWYDRNNRGSDLLMQVVEPFLKPSAYECYGKGQHQVEGAQQQETTEEVVVRGGYLPHRLGQFYHSDNRQQ